MRAIDASGFPLADVATLVHGTTTTTNAFLERKIAKVGLITTRGFRDMLELGRRTRPQPYGMTGTFEPLIDRRYRLEVAERMSAEGEVLVPLDPAEVRTRAEALLAAGCRGDRHPLPPRLRQPGARAAGRSCRPGGLAEPLRHCRPQDPLGVPRVRARLHGLGQRRRPAGAGPLRHQPRRPACAMAATPTSC